MAREIELDPKSDYLIAAPTQKILEQSTLQKFFQEFPQYRQYYVGGSQSMIRHPMGGSIFIRTATEPYGLEGMTIKGAWLDEGGQMKPEVWTVLQARVAIKRGKILITTTPYNMGWLYREFYKRWQAGDPNFLVVNWSSQENPFFPKEEFDRVRATMDPLDFEMRYMGQFRKRHGLVYPDFNDRMLFDKAPERPFNKVLAGIDWGFTAPAGILPIGQDYDNHYWVLDEYYAKQKTTAEIINTAKQFNAKYKVNVFYADSAEPDRIEEAKRANLYVREANKDIKLGIDRVRQIIREGRLHVSNQCRNFIEEIEEYHYPEEGEAGFIKDVPKKENDHLMDALRYAIYTDEPSVVDEWRQEQRIQYTRLNKQELN